MAEWQTQEEYDKMMADMTYQVAAMDAVLRLAVLRKVDDYGPYDPQVVGVDQAYRNRKSLQFDHHDMFNAVAFMRVMLDDPQPEFVAAINNTRYKSDMKR